jgi:hypothetical protein
MGNPFNRHSGGSHSARPLDASTIVTYSAARTAEQSVTSLACSRIARDLERSTTPATLVEVLEPIDRRRELQPEGAEQSCWHQRDVESRKVAAKAKSGFDVLAQSHVCKSLNQRQRSHGGILIVQMQSPSDSQR